MNVPPPGLPVQCTHIKRKLPRLSPQLFTLFLLCTLPIIPLQTALAAPAANDDRATPLVLPRLSGPITLDGYSDEPAWQAIEPLPLTMHQPIFEGAMTERTEIRVAYVDD